MTSLGYRRALGARGGAAGRRMACNSAVRALLVATRLRDILRPDQPIVTLQQDCSVEAALKVPPSVQRSQSGSRSTQFTQL